MWKPTHLCMNQKCPTNSYAGATWSPYSKEDEDIVDCDYCGVRLYQVEEYTPRGHVEIRLWENKNWKITKFLRRKSGWIIGNCIGSNWVQYDDRSIAHDSPYRIPAYVKLQLRFELRRLERLGNV